MEGIKINEAWTAPTIRELAQKMGVDPDGLEKTIRRYNDVFVKNGRDDDFNKAARQPYEAHRRRSLLGLLHRHDRAPHDGRHQHQREGTGP